MKKNMIKLVIKQLGMIALYVNLVIFQSNSLWDSIEKRRQNGSFILPYNL